MQCLLGWLVSDHKTIAGFRNEKCHKIRKMCAALSTPCREMGLLTKASAAIDGSMFKAVNNRD